MPGGWGLEGVGRGGGGMERRKSAPESTLESTWKLAWVCPEIQRRWEDSEGIGN